MERVARATDLRVTTAEEARSCIAHLILAAHSSPQLGSVLLRDHQLEAVRMLGSSIARHGGAILCDPVGTGKTFIALAVASKYRHVTVVAPAVLRPMWLAASELAGIRPCFISHESLSRREASAQPQGVLIIDEAHHARNRATRRFGNLALLACGSDVLMMTATP